jgi:hypothetical protein
MLINCDFKIVREAPENMRFHTKLENRAFSTRHITLELSTNMTNLTARNLKSFHEYILSITQVCYFTQLCHFRLVPPTVFDTPTTVVINLFSNLVLASRCSGHFIDEALPNFGFIYQ